MVRNAYRLNGDAQPPNPVARHVADHKGALPVLLRLRTFLSNARLSFCAIAEAMDLSLAWWEDVGQEHMLRPGCNSAIFIFQMKDRFRDDYRDIQHQHGEHRITHTQEPQIASETLSATAAWLEGLLGEHCDDNSTQTAQANRSNSALAHLT